MCVNNQGNEDTPSNEDVLDFLLCLGDCKQHKNMFKLGPPLEGYRIVQGRIVSVQYV